MTQPLSGPAEPKPDRVPYYPPGWGADGHVPGPYDAVGGHWGTRLVPVQVASPVAVWALVTGVIAVLAGWCLFGLPCLAAITLGHVGEAQTRDGMMSGRGMAVAGLVLGYLSVVPAVLALLWLAPVPQ